MVSAPPLPSSVSWLSLPVRWSGCAVPSNVVIENSRPWRTWTIIVAMFEPALSSLAPYLKVSSPSKSSGIFRLTWVASSARSSPTSDMKMRVKNTPPSK
jgi:hypothetical protein